MFTEIFAALISFFLIDPIEADLRSRLASMNASASTIERAQICVRDSAPKLLKQALDNPSWAVRSGLQISLGWTTPVAVVSEISPECRTAFLLLGSETGGDV
ncbi:MULTISPECIES: hypothetical protein [Rhizobium/Agrobacterium group]|uniref:hypothetical protein n=1 Tax=Rhizobium/Agrobacterium group TaxID=227290 RepID=UPI0011783805|nr:MULTISPECIES: hypothetical protein [Rhizobium/Agrobacterium group]MCF1480698.1 hypothetical protein [Allorhizobium ampelinum]MVA69822.1 hypothetical protein [Agrobacterium vitis]NSZ44550.1 hypothetical protein [Agrobacterium vitis]NTA28297.1 hypothetical protein [Allorhizobium ampelinum]BCH66231.1 hypothetical protein RvVAT039_34470 [Agrobacterium vitis]